MSHESDEDVESARPGSDDEPREPVTPVGPPEPVDLGSHRVATVVGIVAVAVVFLLASVGLGRALDDGESHADVPRVSVPKMDGRAAEDAQRALEDLGLLVAVEYVPNELVPVGVVFDQRPVAGAKLEIGTEVALVVSDGPAGVTVPDVKGFQGGEAAQLLTALGLTPQLQSVHDEVIRPGEVVSTTPAAGNRADPGSDVVVSVSTGPAPRVVPAIVDLSEAAGLAELGRSGVGLGAVTTEYVAGREPGTVLSTDPPAGTSVPRATPVDVVLSGVAESLVVPSVTGLLQSTASGIVADADLVPSIRSQTVPLGDARAGRVIRQSLPAGTMVMPGTPLQLVVGVEATPPTTTTAPAGATTTVVPGG